MIDSFSETGIGLPGAAKSARPVRLAGKFQPRPGELIGCGGCGRVQRLPTPEGGGNIFCGTCGGTLERLSGRSLGGALGCAAATFLLLLPANFLPILQVSIIGETNRSFIASGVAGIWLQHWPVVGLVVGMEIVLLPFIRFGLLVIVLVALAIGFRRPWLGPAFRWAEELDQWAMLDVFLFGGIVGYVRVAHSLTVQIDPGGYCLIAAALFTLVTRAAIDRQDIWRRIGPVVVHRGPDMICCTACGLPVPGGHEGGNCPRCRATVWRVRPYASMRAVALTLAALLFYPAAYIYPMESSDVLGDLRGYSIMTGVTKLLGAGLWFFAGVVFVASVLIPLLKLIAFAWFGMSIYRRSGTRLRLKTRLYRIISTIGRWSHIDVFTISVFLPLMHLPGLLSVIVGKALPAFLAVVFLTMLATALFDPRALWVAAERRQ